MSLDATRWAWKQNVKPMAKLILLSLADRAGEQHEAWPTVARLEADTGMDRKTIMAWTKGLESDGLIAVDRVAGVGNVYRLIGVSDRHTTDDKPVPKTGQVGSGTRPKNGTPTSPKNGTPTSPKNGTPTSPKNGTQNLSIEPTRESITPVVNLSDNSESVGADEKPTVGEIAAAEVCVLWMSLGVLQCNPSHPRLIELIAMGASGQDFECAGREAVTRGKGFGYALAIVQGLLAERVQQVGGGSGVVNMGGQRGKHGKSSGGSRIEHSRRIGEHLDKLIEAEFGSGVGLGAV